MSFGHMASFAGYACCRGCSGCFGRGASRRRPCILCRWRRVRTAFAAVALTSEADSTSGETGTQKEWPAPVQRRGSRTSQAVQEACQWLRDAHHLRSLPHRGSVVTCRDIMPSSGIRNSKLQRPHCVAHVEPQCVFVQVWVGSATFCVYL